MLLILQNRQFRLLWLSLGFSEVALGMYIMVHGWLALTVTDTPFWVGATAGMSGLGLMSSAAVGGVLLDRVDRRKLIVVSEIINAALMLALAGAILVSEVRLWQILAVAFFAGLVAGLVSPATKALTLDLVGRERLLSATAANHTVMSTTGIVAPLLAGTVVSNFEIGWAYVIMGGMSLLSAVTLLLIGAVPRVGESRGSPLQDLKEGVRYVFTSPTIRALLFLALVGDVFGMGHEIMLPVMARDVLHIGPSGLGFLIAAGMAGGAVSALVLASVGDIKRKGRLLVIGYGGFAVFLLLFTVSRSFPLSMVLLAMGWATWMAYETSLGTLLQTVVPNELRGRVLSAYSFTWGASGFSGFYTGAVATLLGAPVAIAIGAGVLLLNTARVARGLFGFESPAEPPRAVG